MAANSEQGEEAKPEVSAIWEDTASQQSQNSR